MPERPAAVPPLRFLFFGAGAVGSLPGARLAQAGSEVTLVGRQEHVEAVTRGGVRMVVAGKVSSQSVRAARPTLADAGGPFDYVFLTVKGYDTLDAIEQLQLVLRPGTILGSFQNGVGNEEAIVAALPGAALLGGRLGGPPSPGGPAATARPDAARASAWWCSRQQDAVAVVGPQPRQGPDRGLLSERRGGRRGPSLRCPDAGQLGALGDPGKVDEAPVRVGALSPATRPAESAPSNSPNALASESSTYGRPLSQSTAVARFDRAPNRRPSPRPRRQKSSGHRAAGCLSEPSQRTSVVCR